MRLILALLLLLAPAAPGDPIQVTLHATQRGRIVEAHITAIFAWQLGDATITVQHDAGLTPLASVADGAACDVLTCTVTLNGGYVTVPMTTTFMLEYTGEHLIGVAASLPGQPVAADSIAIETYYSINLPLVAIP